MKHHKKLICKKWIERLFKQHNINKNCYVLLQPLDWPTIRWHYRAKKPKNFTVCKQAMKEIIKFQEHKFRKKNCACTVPNSCLFKKVNVHTLIKECEEKGRVYRKDYTEQTKKLCKDNGIPVSSLTGCIENGKMRVSSLTGSPPELVKIRDCVVTLQPCDIVLQADRDHRNECRKQTTRRRNVCKDGEMSSLNSSPMDCCENDQDFSQARSIEGIVDIIPQADADHINECVEQIAQTKDLYENGEMIVSLSTGSHRVLCKDDEMPVQTGSYNDKIRDCTVIVQSYIVPQIDTDCRNGYTEQTTQTKDLCNVKMATSSLTRFHADLCENDELKDSTLTESFEGNPPLWPNDIPQIDTNHGNECMEQTAQTGDLCEGNEISVSLLTGPKEDLCRDSEKPVSSQTESPQELAKIRDCVVTLQPYDIVLQADTNCRNECMEQTAEIKNLEVTIPSSSESTKDSCEDVELPVPAQTGFPEAKNRGCFVSLQAYTIPHINTDHSKKCTEQTAQTKDLCGDSEMTVTLSSRSSKDLCKDNEMQNSSLTESLEDKIRDCSVTFGSNDIPQIDSNHRNKCMKHTVQSKDLSENCKMAILSSIASIDNLCAREGSEIPVSLQTESPEAKIRYCSVALQPYIVPQIDSDHMNECIYQTRQEKDEITKSSTGSPRDLCKDGEMSVVAESPKDKIRNCTVSLHPSVVPQTETERRNTCIKQTPQTKDICKDVEIISLSPGFSVDLCEDDEMQDSSLIGSPEREIRDCIVPFDIVPHTDTDPKNKCMKHTGQSNHLCDIGKMTMPSTRSIRDAEMPVSSLTGSSEAEAGGSAPLWHYVVPHIYADNRNECMTAQTKDRHEVTEMTASTLAGSQHLTDKSFVDGTLIPSVGSTRNCKASSENEYIESVPIDTETGTVKRFNPYSRDLETGDQDMLCEGSVSDLTIKCLFWNVL